MLVRLVVKEIKELQTQKCKNALLKDRYRKIGQDRMKNGEEFIGKLIPREIKEKYIF